MDEGYTRIQVLEKGIAGWKEAGFTIL